MPKLGKSEGEGGKERFHGEAWRDGVTRSYEGAAFFLRATPFLELLRRTLLKGGTGKHEEWSCTKYFYCLKFDMRI
jgi:hypothetical protein